MCALLTRMQIRHARTHSGHGVHRGREEGEGQTDRQSPRAVAVGLSRSTELRLPPPRRMPLLLLIALRKDGAPTSVPPPPPNHVAPSADRPIGPGAGADLTSVRLSTSERRRRLLRLLHVLHYTTRSLTPIPCSMLDRSKSVARVRSRPASLPRSLRSRRSLLFPLSASRATALSFQTAAVARHYPTQTLLPNILQCC